MSGIGIKEAAFTGYASTDMARSRKFYGETLGLPEGMVYENEGELHWLEFTIPGGHTLAIARSCDQWLPSPHGGGICLEVESLEAALDHLQKAGVTIAMPIQDFPICRLALIADPDGNTIALHQKKSNHPDCSHS